MLRRIYLGLAIIGFVLPYSQFLPWLADRGLDWRGFLAGLFANPISSFFGLDVIIAALAVCVFAWAESRRGGLPHAWAPVAGTLLVGVSFGLPLLLYLRESRRASLPSATQPKDPA